MSISIEMVERSQAQQLRSMLLPYLSELGVELEYRYLDLYWTDQDRYPYFIRKGNVIVGFALLPSNMLQKELAEFYIIPEHRGQKIGSYAFNLLLRKYPGRWSLGVFTQNESALAFWESACPEPKSREIVASSSGRTKVIFNFEVST